MVVVFFVAFIFGGVVGIFASALCAASGNMKMEEEHREAIRACEETIAKQAQVINEKNKFIIRFKYGCIDAVQKYLQDDVVACTMIIATINGLKEKNEIQNKTGTMQEK